MHSYILTPPPLAQMPSAVGHSLPTAPPQSAGAATDEQADGELRFQGRRSSFREDTYMRML